MGSGIVSFFNRNIILPEIIFYSRYLHGQHSRCHLGRAETAQEVVQHFAGCLFVGFGPQQEILEPFEELPLLLLSLTGKLNNKLG